MRPPQMSSKPEPVPAAPRVRGSGVRAVYETLRKSILELELEPGSPLDEVTLSERFDMSRTPIRETLIQLASMGLVVIRPRRGAIVAELGPQQLVEMFEREYIEDLMRRHKMNLSAAAREAQIDRKHLRELIRKYGLDSRAKLDGDEEPAED